MTRKADRKIKRWAGLALAVFGLSLSLGWPALADEQLVDLPAATKPESRMEAQVQSERLLINQEVAGDLYCAGDEVEIAGAVGGDIICAASILRINAKVAGDVRVAGGNVSFGDEAVVAGNVSVAGASINLESGAKLQSELYAMGGSITNEAQVLGKTGFYAGQVWLHGQHGANVDVYASNFVVGSNAVIDGKLTYSAPRSDIHTNAKITERESIATPEKHRRWTFSHQLVSSVFMFLALLTTGGLMLLIKHSAINKITDRFSVSAVAKDIFYGLGTLVLGLLLAILSLITPITWMVGLIVLLVVLLISLLSLPVVSYFAGRLIFTKLLNRTGHFMAKLAVGAAALLVVGLIPVLGGLVMMLAFFLGVGQIIHYLIEDIRQGNRPAEVTDGRATASPKQIAKKLEEAELEVKDKK